MANKFLNIILLAHQISDGAVMVAVVAVLLISSMVMGAVTTHLKKKLI